MKLRSVALYSLTGALALVAFTWPLFIAPGAGMDRATLGPFLFAIIVPLVLALVVSEISRDGISPKALAMLGVLSALGCVARPLSAGVAGLELTFILIILGGRVFGPSFGFLLGNTTLLSSALITGGVGPWLPYQMLGAGFVGMGAAALPRLRGAAELIWLSAYSFVAGFAYGWLLDLAFWPFSVGLATDASFVPGAGILDNLHRFVIFNLLTSMGWNLGRSITTVVGIWLLGTAMLRVLRRTTRQATFVDA